jgi:hypothetical protein
VKKNTHVFRVCAVCGLRHGVTYGFRSTLTRLGIPGDKAVKECVIKAAAERDPKIRAKKKEVKG